MACMRLVCRKVKASNSSSIVPNPPGKTTRASTAKEEVQLSQGKVMKLEAELRRDISVGCLLGGEPDVQPDRFRFDIESPAVCCFHDSRSTSGDDDVVPGLGALTECRDLPRELASFVIVPAFR